MPNVFLLIWFSELTHKTCKYFFLEQLLLEIYNFNEKCYEDLKYYEVEQFHAEVSNKTLNNFPGEADCSVM